MDVTIYPDPNPAVTAALRSAATRVYLEERGQTAKMLYQAQVAKRTARLAASAHVDVGIGGVENDRLVADLVVGGRGSLGAVDYAAAHDFGADVIGFDGERHLDANPAHHDLKEVLQMLEGY
ncbi:hypothetical protein A5722_05140 [Mycobacterium vulneris]|nr:hypothetical protein A5722_05140 [Mycolicibacterium vulneris]OCB61502.1 hypothetical protein A5729_03815 [Mycolicibacterium vulneris]